MRSLAGILADGVLADTFLFPSRPPISHTNIIMVRGPKKSSEISTTKNIY